MAISKVDGIELKQALEQFGSLKDAIQHLQKEKFTLEKQNAKLKQDNEKLAETGDRLNQECKELGKEIVSNKSHLQVLLKQIEEHSRQYELFCGFVAMVAESPSVTDSIEALITLFQKLKEPGWYLPKSADEMRSLFVRIVMGDYLKSYRCDSCGSKFIVNKDPHYKFYGNEYYCPACHFSLGVKEDDSFLKAMVSEQQLENIRRIEEVLKENETLTPLKAFLDVPCEICGKPVNEWNTQNVKLAIEDTGFGHSVCWNSEMGQLRQLRKAIEKVKKS